MAGNINELRNLNLTFKRSVLAKNNQQNLHLIAELRQSQDEQQREVYRDQQTKWDRFRQRRKYYIELYLKLRRKQVRVQELMRLMTTRLAMLEVYQVYNDRKMEMLRMQRQIYINFKIAWQFKKRTERWGGDLRAVHRGRIKRCLSFVNNAMTHARHSESKGILEPFLRENAVHDKTKSKVRYFFHLI